MKYTSLHNHTDYSNIRLVDSTNTQEKLIDKAIELGLNGLALTEHDCVGGHVKALDYYNKIKDKNPDFKLILGNEIYLTRSDLTAVTHEKGEKFYHLILLAKDKIGHDQIREISSRAWSRSYVKNMIRVPTYSEDLIDIIGSNPGHVIISTACLGSYCGVKFQLQEYESIDRHLNLLSQICGLDNFYIELQPSFYDTQRNYNFFMYNKYKDKFNFIITTDSHYIKEEKGAHKVFLQSKDGDREVDEFYASAYLMDADELKSYFDNKLPADFINKCLDNTNKINSECESYSLKHQQEIPKIKYDIETIDPFYDEIVNDQYSDYKNIKNAIQKNHSADIHLLNLIANGWREKLEEKDINFDKYLAELDYEIEQICGISEQMNSDISDYFITMAKFIDIIWEKADSIVGVARGSGGSSLINYLIGITQMDPLDQPQELPFWRFMHTSRPGLPDIDTDTESTKRTKIFNKIQEYMNSMGGDLINIATFGTIGSKSAINTAGKGLNIDDDILSYLTSMIPNERGKDLTLTQCYYGDSEHNPISKFKEIMDNNGDLFKCALIFEGLTNHIGVHASGVLALNEKIYNKFGCMKTSTGTMITCYDLEDVESCGGLKYDFLTIQCLDKIRTCMNLLLEDNVIQWQDNLRNTYNKYISPDAININDQSIWDSLNNGKVPDAFQLI